MSLFKTRDWWTIPVESDTVEECDLGHLVIGNITNEDPACNKIIVGGFSGALKIYVPQTFYNEEEEKTIYGYRPDHLVTEIALGIPILQLAIGKFVSGNSGLHLCVLHQDHFVVYSVSVIAGQAGHGSQTKISKAYQHNFQRKAFSITTGNFGSVKGRDFIAVQSLDGCISFYEQESVGFVCFLPGFLLPGPLVYLPKSDTLVTQASDWTLQSYKYQTLSVLVQEGAKSTANIKFGGKRIQPEWTQILAEGALDIKILVEPGNVSTLIVLTSRAFMCYKDSGILKFIKKLEFNPICFTAYHHDKTIHICVASHTKNLLIYKESELKWASQLHFTPVAMERSDFKGIKGGMVLLGEEGQLQVCYLGTDPSLFIAPPHETREINYEHTDMEMGKLNKIIRSSTKDIGSIMTFTTRDKELLVAATVGNKLEAWTGQTMVNDPDGVPSVTVVIRLTTQSPLKTVRVNVHVEKPISVTQDTFVMSTICDNCQILVKFYLAEQYVPSSLDVTIVTSYISINGAPYVTRTMVSLPLKLVVKPSAPNKEADHKITISTNKPAVNLPELFTEFGLDSSVATALGLQYYGGANVTILSSKTSNRYRLQSDSLSSIWVIFQSMRERLERYWEKEPAGSEEKLNLIVTSQMPTQELFSEIDAHFLRRKKHKELESQLVQRATQFRAVQRRLLTKFKDKTPTPLTNFDNLLDGTYKQILQLTDAVNSNLKGLEEDGCLLSCVIRLLIELLCLQANLEAPQKELLMATLSPIVYHNMEQGWEEVINNSTTFILRTILGKGNRETGVYTQTLTIPADTNKLKKHISIFVDKVLKGGFTSQSELKNKLQESKNLESSIPEERDSSENDDSFMGEPTFPVSDGTEVPMGSKLGEDRARSARIRSARQQSARSARVAAIREEDRPVVNGEENEEDVDSSSAKDVSLAEENAQDVIETNLEEKPEPIYAEIQDYDDVDHIYEEIKDLRIPDKKDDKDDKEDEIIGINDGEEMHTNEDEEMGMNGDEEKPGRDDIEDIEDKEKVNVEEKERDDKEEKERDDKEEEMEEDKENLKEEIEGKSDMDDVKDKQRGIDDVENKQKDDEDETDVMGDNIETLKKATAGKDSVIEAPSQDIFGNPIDDDNW